MIELFLLFAVIAVFHSGPTSLDEVGERARVGVVRLVLLGLFFALVLGVTGQGPTGEQWLQWFRKQAVAIESVVAGQVFFSSSPQPGVVKQKMGSSRALEKMQ